MFFTDFVLQEAGSVMIATKPDLTCKPIMDADPERTLMGNQIQIRGIRIRNNANFHKHQSHTKI